MRRGLSARVQSDLIIMPSYKSLLKDPADWRSSEQGRGKSVVSALCGLFVGRIMRNPLHRECHLLYFIYFLYAFVQYLFLCQLQWAVISAGQRMRSGESENPGWSSRVESGGGRWRRAATAEIYGRRIKRIISKRMCHKGGKKTGIRG